MATKFVKGDRVAYAAKFLRDTCQHTGSAPERRGTFDRFEFGTMCRVHWDDIEACIASGAGQYADSEYCEEVRANGSLVGEKSIAKVGSARFALNDL